MHAGLAALVELLSEPLYILAQLRLRLQLRVFAEASATLARGVATLALLKLSVMDVGISLSVAQVRSGVLHEWSVLFECRSFTLEYSDVSVHTAACVKGCR